MACAYVVLAHKDPAHLARLTTALRPAPVFLHVDARLPPDRARPLYAAAAGAQPLPRHATKWASWALVDALLDGLRAALREDVSHVAILSGQDYVLRSSAAIDAFLGEHAGRSFCHLRPLPYARLGRDGGMHRVRYWHTPVRGRRVFVPVPRRLPVGVVPTFGQQWCVLAREAARAVLDLHTRRPELARYYRHTWIPDEGFVPTLLASTQPSLENVNENLWFARWNQGPHPTVLGDDDFADLTLAARQPSKVGGRARVKLFARKFESHASASLLDAIDDHVVPAPLER